ncbi:MAG: toll/interleukin-1 receptor domain-containing protein [Bacillota bacterium]|nr:toll/interleukin-1 receptor domain-containing protein [Bacillota bacterium]
MELKYDAFISYRHKDLDITVAKAIHKQIETYRIPGSIKKKTGRQKMGKVFRDQDELPLMADLGEGIIRALDASDWLIVVCTPDLPQSRWCLAEIDHFIKTGRRDRILTVLAAGEPEESFPPQLRFVEDEDGNIIEKEPLAADIRAKSKAQMLKKLRNEKLRLLAPMLGVGYDDLRRRQRERALRLTVGVSLAAVVFFAAFGGYVLRQNVLLQKQMEETERQRSTAQRSQSLFLADLSQQQLEKNNPVHAVLLALEALPDNLEQPERPYVIEAEYALRKAENYLATPRWNQVRSFEYEGRALAIDSGSTGKYVLLETAEDNVYIFDAHTGEAVSHLDMWEMHADALFPGSSLESYYLIDKDSKILYRSYKGLQSFDAMTGALLAEIPFPHDEFSWIDIYEDEDGGYIVLDDNKGWFFVYDFDLNLLFSSEPPEEVGVKSKVVKMAAGKHLLATGYITGQVRLWDVKTGEMVIEHYKNELTLEGLKYYRGEDGRPDYFLSLSSGVICFINAESGELVRLVRAPEGAKFKDAVYSPVLDEFTISYMGNEVSSYDFWASEPHSSTERYVRLMEYSPDGKMLFLYLYGEISSYSAATLEGWSNGELILSLSDIQAAGTYHVTEQDRKNGLIYVVRDNNLASYKASDSIAAPSIGLADEDGEEQIPAFYCFSPDSSLFMVVYKGGTAVIYDAKTSQLLTTIKHDGLTGTNLDAGFSSDNRYIWFSSLDNGPVVLKLQTKEEVSPPWTDLPIDFKGVISPDGRRYILTHPRTDSEMADYTAEFDVLTGEELHRVNFDISRRGWYSPDGKQVVLGDQNRFYILDAEDWSIQHELRGSWNEFLTMNFHWVNIRSMRALELTTWKDDDTGDGNRIAVADLAAGRRLWEQSLDGIKVEDAALNSDASLVAVLYNSSHVRVYEVDTGVLRYDVLLPYDTLELAFGVKDHILLINRERVAFELWDLEEGKPFAHYDAGVRVRLAKRCNFSPDGNLLVMEETLGGSDFHLRRCDRLDNVVSRMQYWLDGRTLSASEKQRYFLTE